MKHRFSLVATIATLAVSNLCRAECPATIHQALADVDAGLLSQASARLDAAF